ncbi:MAG: polyprenol monophosphomannose synthase [Candidatus Bathyarchaeia archaeon]
MACTYYEPPGLMTALGILENGRRLLAPMTIAIVVPTVNERENIEQLLPRTIEILSKSGLDSHIFIIDDESSDGTAEAAEKIDSGRGLVHVIRRRGKRGLGSAYKDAFKLVLESSYDAAVQMDADLSHDPIYLPQFFRYISEGYDLVIGSRYVPGGSIPDWKIYRRFISRTINGLVRLLLVINVRVCTSGYRAYSIRALRVIDMDNVRSDGYAFQVEMTMLCEKAGLRIVELPITFLDRQRGKSKLSRKEMWNFVKSILNLASSRRC